MAYIPKNSKTPKVGDWVYTTITHESLSGLFTPGSFVKITGVDSMRGYDIEDEHGNRVCEIGWKI